MDEAKSFIVIGVGEIHLDHLSDRTQLGGAPAIFIHHARALGARGILASSIGQDEAGRDVMERLEASGLPSQVIHLDPAHPTAVVRVSLDSHGSPSYVFPNEAAWDYLPFAPECAALAQKADAICFGTVASRNPHSRDCIRKFLEAAMPGCLRVFDVNLRENYYSREVVEELLEHAEVLKLNEDELPVVADLLHISGSAKERMEVLMGMFALDAIALTRGARGSVLMTPHDFEVHHGVRVEHMVNTLGASDAFTAALVMGLLNGQPLAEISEHANKLASFVCTLPGAMTAHPEGAAAA